MMRFSKTRMVALVTSLFVAVTLLSTDFSEARRGGSFGSRGTRTFDSVPATRTAPTSAAPVERSMTPNPGPTTTQPTTPSAPTAQPAMPQRPGLFGGLGGLARGLLLGGLIGALLGYGFGGLAGMLGFLVQAALLAVGAFFLISWLRSRRTPAAAGGPQPSRGFDFGRENLNREAATPPNGRAGSFAMFSSGAASPAPSVAFETTQADLDTFERRLAEVQDAFAKEDHAALRRLCTPEIVSFFSEELADNAKRGVRNDVRDTRLLQADIAESWREGDQDYASAAFRYRSVDVLRDRTTGAIVEGKDEPSETTEIWTFVRRKGEDWKLSAIQEAQA